MKICVISGGSGSTDLCKGLYQLLGYLPDNLINMYDDGKSTGDIRKKLNILGPSDLRKVQCEKAMIEGNGKLADILNDRYSNMTFADMINRSNIIEYVPFTIGNLLNNFAKRFNEELIYDYCLGNVVYGVLMEAYGIEKTIEIMKGLLKLESDVYVDSYSLAILKAETLYGNTLNDEASIVDYEKSNDPIVGVYLDREIKVNPRAIKFIESCDLVIISTGTFYSSLLPTIMNKDINKALKGKHIIVAINAADDGDSRDFSTFDYMNRYIDVLRDYKPDFITASETKAVGRKHDGEILARHILYRYIKVTILGNRIHTLVLDVDGTLDDKSFSLIKNIPNLRIVLVSGNSVGDNLLGRCVNKLENNATIFAEAGQIIVNHKSKSDIDEELSLLQSDTIQRLDKKLIRNRGYRLIGNVVRYKSNNREELKQELSTDLRPYNHICDINLRGNTSVEISVRGFDKINAFYDSVNNDASGILYIGNEPEGNDKKAMNLFTSIAVKSSKETNCLLEMIVDVMK